MPSFVGNIIQEEISLWEERQPLRLHQISRRHAVRDVRGKGAANCRGCRNRWTSYQTWVTLDFNDPDSFQVYTQLCRSCLSECRPRIHETEFRRIIKIAIQSMEKSHAGRAVPRHQDGGYRPGPPHRCDLCGKCNFGRGPCCVGKTGCFNPARQNGYYGYREVFY